jgi:hypothetical protein
MAPWNARKIRKKWQSVSEGRQGAHSVRAAAGNGVPALPSFPAVTDPLQKMAPLRRRFKFGA